MESDVTATDSAWRGRSGKRTVQLGFSGSGTRTVGDASGTVAGSGTQSFSVSWSETDTDGVFTDRMNADAREPLHAFRADITYVFALAQGYRNAPANAVGFGPRGVRTSAERVPGGVVFWVSETDVREDPRLAALAGLPHAVPKPDRLLPPYFVRSKGRALGPATVPEALPAGPLDAFVEALGAEATRRPPVRSPRAAVRRSTAWTPVSRRSVRSSARGHWPAPAPRSGSGRSPSCTRAGEACTW